MMEAQFVQALKLGNTCLNHTVNNQCLNFVDLFLSLFFRLDMDTYF